MIVAPKWGKSDTLKDVTLSVEKAKEVYNLLGAPDTLAFLYRMIIIVLHPRFKRKFTNGPKINLTKAL